MLPTVVYGAMTGAGGRFSVDPIAAGTYYATLERPGFVSPVAIKPVVKLKAGERVSDLKLEMAPRTAISGRVLDEYGDPVQYASVQATPVAGRPMYEGMYSFATTDERGEFRIGVGPGKYHVKANPQSGPGTEVEIRTDGTTEAVYGETYYPSAATPERAITIEAAAGREVAGVEIRLARRPDLAISGVVTGKSDGRWPAFVSLMFSAGTGRGSQATSVREDGKFMFRNLSPGLYRIYAQSVPSEEQRLYSPLLELTLEGADITGVQLPLAPAEDLTGSVQFEGEPAEAASLETLTVLLEPTTMSGMTPGSGSVKAGKDGAFRLRAVPPGRYRVRVQRMPEYGYIKTVQMDGTAVSDGVLDLTRGGGGGSVVRIVLSRNGAQVGGTVRARDDAIASETDGFVYLFQDPESLRPENLGKISPEGKYVFKGVRPGTYRLIAVEPLFLAGARGSEGATELAARAEQIEVKEGDRLTKDLKITAREDADAKKR